MRRDCPGPAALRRTRRARIAIGHARELSELVRVDEQVAELRIERRAAPVHAAVIAGKLQAQPLVAARQIRPADLHAFHQLPARGLELRRHRRDVRRRHRHARRAARGLSGNGCVFAGALERHFARRHRTLLDAVDRLAGDAIEQEQQARLVDHGHGRNRPAALLDVDQRRRAPTVRVPDVVVHDLEVPEVLAGVRVGRDEAGAEEIVAGAIAAVLIDRRRAERHVDDAALRRRP